jgi:hypothetical protein
MWNPNHHSDSENLNWAWFRASEWYHWPRFITLPIAPILLYLYPWQWVVVSITLATVLWWLIVAPRFTPPLYFDVFRYFVAVRFITSPLMAYLIWQRGDSWTAAIAFFGFC